MTPFLRAAALSCFLVIAISGRGQSFADSCFYSCNPGTSFPGSGDLFSFNADLLEWTGASWTGAWPAANVTLPPPVTTGACRAVWIGNGTTWTTGGEGYAVRLTTPLVTGQNYSITFTYVSHGNGSNGNFAPFLYTNSVTNIGSAAMVMTLPSVGAAWTTNTITFTATAAQNGHTWILVHNGTNGSSGMFINFCVNCSNVPPPPPPTCSVSIGADTTLCTGNTLLLNATTAGASYLWQDNSTNPTYVVTGPGLYWVEIDDGACIARDSINVVFSAPPLVTLTPDTSICSGQNVTLTASGGSSYLWSTSATTSSITVSPAAATMYSVIVTGNTCSTIDSVLVIPLPPISATATSANVTCNGAADGSATVTPSGGSPPYAYAWSPSGGTGATANGLAPGNYVVTITDSAGCTQTQNVAITQPASLTVNIAGNTTACSGVPSSFTAAAQGGIPLYAYTWSGGLPAGASQNVTVTAQTSYICTVTDANGCTATQTITITPSASPVAAFGPGGNGCAPFAMNFTNSSQGASTYEWNFGDNSTSTAAAPSHTYTQAGLYPVTLIVTSAAGCTDTLTQAGFVQVSSTPQAAFTISTNSVTETQPNVYFTDASVNTGSCVLYFGDGDSTLMCGFGNLPHAYPGVGNYCATLIATSGVCADTAVACLDVQPDFAFYIPNTFTPDGNGLNDVFTGYGGNVADFHMMIFDRWGNLIFESSDLAKPWDGRAQDGTEILQVDCYVYKIEVKDLSGQAHRYIGGVNLVR